MIINFLASLSFVVGQARHNTAFRVWQNNVESHTAMLAVILLASCSGVGVLRLLWCNIAVGPLRRLSAPIADKHKVDVSRQIITPIVEDLPQLVVKIFAWQEQSSNFPASLAASTAFTVISFAFKIIAASISSGLATEKPSAYSIDDHVWVRQPSATTSWLRGTITAVEERSNATDNRYTVASATGAVYSGLPPSWLARRSSFLWWWHRDRVSHDPIPGPHLARFQHLVDNPIASPEASGSSRPRVTHAQQHPLGAELAEVAVQMH